MKKIFVIALVFVTSFSANASSLHPCTPTVKAGDTRLHCDGEKVSYVISIHTLMSRPIPECQDDNYVEYQTATVKVFSKKTGRQKIYDLFSGFDYSLGEPGQNNGYFTSESPLLDLSGCTTPSQGGVSIGN